MSIRQVRRSGSVLVNGLNATAGSPVSADTSVVGAAVVGDVVVVGGATEDSDRDDVAKQSEPVRTVDQLERQARGRFRVFAQVSGLGCIDLGTEGPEFNSRQPDHLKIPV